MPFSFETIAITYNQKAVPLKTKAQKLREDLAIYPRTPKDITWSEKLFHKIGWIDDDGLSE